MLYRVISWCARRALHWCYRDAHIVGRIPATGPVLLAVNHPNDLADICAVLTFAGRRVTFVANVTSAESPVVAWAYQQMGVIPVHRVRDARRAKARGEDSAMVNAQAFTRVTEVLAAGGCVCVFPEGGVHRGLHLAPLRTGLARMALDARDSADVRDLLIVPVGLTYEAPYHVRSRLLGTVGESIRLDEWKADSSRAAEPQLTAEVAARLRSVTRNAPDEQSTQLLRALAGAAAATSEGAEPLLDGTRAWQRYAVEVFGPGLAPLPEHDAKMEPVRKLLAALEKVGEAAREQSGGKGGPSVSLERLLLAWSSARSQRDRGSWWLTPLAWCGLLLHAPAWWLIARWAERAATIREEIMPRRIVPGLYIATLWYVLLLVGGVAALRVFGVSVWLSVVLAAALVSVAPGLGTAALIWLDQRRDRNLARLLREHAPILDQLLADVMEKFSADNPRTTAVG